MAAPRNVSFTIRARDATRAAFRGITRSIGAVRNAVFSLNSLLAGAVGAGLVQLGLQAARAGREILVSSQTFNIAEDNVEAFRNALESLGFDQSNVDDIFRGLVRAQGILNQGGPAGVRLAEQLAELGFAADEIRRSRLDGDFFLTRLFELIENAPTGQVSNILNQIFGEGPTFAINAFSKNIGTIQNAVDQLNEQGLNQTTEALEAQAEVAREIETAFKQIRNELGATLADNKELILDILQLANTTLEIIRELQDVAPEAFQQAGERAGQTFFDASRGNVAAIASLTAPGQLGRLIAELIAIRNNTAPENQRTLTEQ